MIAAVLTGLLLAIVYFYILKGVAIFSLKGSIYMGLFLNLFGFILRLTILSLVFILLSRSYMKDIAYVFIGFLAGFLLLGLRGIGAYLLIEGKVKR